MLFNVYDQNNQVIGQVEGNTSSEAWHYARRMYEKPDRIVFDVRLVEPVKEEPPLNWYKKLFTEEIDGQEFYRVKNYYPMGWPDNPRIEVAESSIAKDIYRDWQERARYWTFETWSVAVLKEAGKPLV